MRSRRVTTLLIAWLSLFGVAVPAVACAGVILHHDCCPGEGMPPCDECTEKSPAPDISPSDCLTAPVAVAQAGASLEPAWKIAEPDFKPAAIVSILPTIPSLIATPESFRHRWRPPRVETDTPVYLATGRLRL